MNQVSLAGVWLGLIGILIFGASIGFFKIRNKIKNQKEITESIINYYHKQYHEETFTDIDNNYKNYTCFTLDEGKTWYLINKQRKVLGNFDRLHPGLRKKIEDRHKAFDELVKYAEENGPIGSRPITNKDIEVLTKAGFEVKQSKK